MAHGYRTLQHWDQWLASSHLGKSLLQEETHALSGMLDRHFGKHALLIGVPNQYKLLSSCRIPCHSLVSPLVHQHKNIDSVESDLHELPILTGSIDLVMLPHTLEFVDNPRGLLQEACRIIKPEGLIVISGFNPYSFWGIKKIFSAQKSNPWLGNLNQVHKVKHWLRLADFELEKQHSLLFRLPVESAGLYKKFQFIEKVGKPLFPFLGGEYILVARAKVIPLTPIRLKWKQKLSGIRVSPTFTGHVVGQSRHDQ